MLSTKKKYVSAFFAIGVFFSLTSCQRNTGCGYWGNQQKIQQQNDTPVQCHNSFVFIKKI